jgi:hypothetical protein
MRTTQNQSLRPLSLPLILATAAGFAGCGGPPDQPVEQAPSSLAAATPDSCALLDNKDKRALLSSAFEMKLLIKCGRVSEIRKVAALPPETTVETEASAAAPTNVSVNDPALDVIPPGGTNSHTQSETSLALNQTTGTICSVYNDSYGFFTAGIGFTGFSRSTNAGTSFTDQGAVPVGTGADGTSFGDPSVVWRKKDGKFYLTTLDDAGLGLWISNDDCQTFTFLANVHSFGDDDKEMMAVDNNTSSAHFGRLYIAWSNFAADQFINSTFSDDGTTWSTPVALSTATQTGAQGAWPMVTPSGKLYVAFANFFSSSDTLQIKITSSTNGGVSFGTVVNAATGIQPFDTAATADCGRNALHGDIRFASFPQIAADSSNCVHLVYTSGPNHNHTGDVANIFYKKSCDGVTWGSAKKINDDGGTKDQFMATLSVGKVGTNSVVSIGWYDRRNDTNNLKFDFYDRTSHNDGSTFGTSRRITTSNSPVFIDPNLNTCYHGDYDQQLLTSSSAYITWSDDRRVQDGHNDPDVRFAKITP